MSLLGADLETRAEIAERARGRGVLVVANINGAGQIVLSGDLEACARVPDIARDAQGAARDRQLQVAGAFHSPLMEPARLELEQALRDVPIRDASIPVVSNVDRRRRSRSAAEIRAHARAPAHEPGALGSSRCTRSTRSAARSSSSRPRAPCSRASRSASSRTPKSRSYAAATDVRGERVMKLDLSGRNAVVTGASRGIGRAIAVALARGRRRRRRRLDPPRELRGRPDARSSAAGGKAQAFACDVSAARFGAGRSPRPSQKALGSVDIVVNNAGITRDGLVMRMSEADWDAVLDTNLKGAFNVVKAFSKPLLRSQHGRVDQRRLGRRRRRQRRTGQLRREQGRAHRPHEVAREGARLARRSP